jgi:hypothetical protein
MPETNQPALGRLSAKAIVYVMDIDDPGAFVDPISDSRRKGTFDLLTEVAR